MEPKEGIINKYSNKKTALNLAYKNFLDEIKPTLDDETEERWEVYDMILSELVRGGYNSEFEEYKYRITDNENPNFILYDILNRIDGTPLTYIFTNNLKRYIDEDNMSRFYY